MYLCQLFLLSKYWEDVFQNAIGCAIGSAAAIAFSILIYWLTNRDNRMQINKENQDSIKDQLQMFQFLLEDVVKTSEKTLGYIDKFILDLKEQTVVFPILSITSLGNFRRIIDTNAFDKTGKSYKKYFSEESSLQEYRDIINSVDHLFSIFDGLHSLLERATDNHTERLLKVSEAFDLADKILIDTFSKLEIKSPVVRQMAEIKLKFVSDRKNAYDMEGLYNLYFLPMNELMKKIITSGVQDDFIVNYTYELTKGIDCYKSVHIGTEKFSETMTSINQSAEKSLNKLKLQVGKIAQEKFATRLPMPSPTA